MKVVSVNNEELGKREHKVAMMQPTFLPWQGYFELIYYSDTFIFLDDFQYVVGSFHGRNRLFIEKNKVDYITIPIDKKSSFKKELNQTKILIDDYWLNKFYKKMKMSYEKTPFYEKIFSELYAVISNKDLNLAEYNMSIIKFLCNLLGIKTTFVLSSNSQFDSVRSYRVYDLLKSINATTYLSAHGSFEYMLEDKVFPCEIPVLFQNYIPQPYSQKHSKEFVPYLSILDALFNIGPEKTLELIKTGTQIWLTWEMMKNNFFLNNGGKNGQRVNA